MLIIAISMFKGPEVRFTEYCGIDCNDSDWVYSATNGQDSFTVSKNDKSSSYKMHDVGFVLINQHMLSNDSVQNLIDSFRNLRCFVWVHESSGFTDENIYRMFLKTVDCQMFKHRNGKTPVERFMVNLANGADFEQEYALLINHSKMMQFAKLFEKYYPLWVDLCAIKTLQDRRLPVESYLEEIVQTDTKDRCQVAINEVENLMNDESLPGYCRNTLALLLGEMDLLGKIVDAHNTYNTIPFPVKGLKDVSFTKGEKSIVLATSNAVLIKAFQRLINYLYNIPVKEFSEQNFRRDDVLIYLSADVNLEKWLWEDVRTKLQACNPIAVIGAESEEHFKILNPIFDVMPEVHRYFALPFDLEDLKRFILGAQTISDTDYIPLLVRNYGREYEWFLLDHEFKIEDGNLLKTLLNVNRVKKYYELSERTDLVNLIDNTMKIDEKSGEWKPELINLKIKLIKMYNQRRRK